LACFTEIPLANTHTLIVHGAHCVNPEDAWLLPLLLDYAH
jgi:hypothetical protein